MGHVHACRTRFLAQETSVLLKKSQTGGQIKSSSWGGTVVVSGCTYCACAQVCKLRIAMYIELYFLSLVCFDPSLFECCLIPPLDFVFVFSSSRL